MVRFQNSQISLVPGSADRGDENDAEVNRDSLGASAGLVVNSEMLAWGRGGMRSNTRHSNQSAGNIKIARSNRLSKLLESLQDTVEEDAVIMRCRTECSLSHTPVICLSSSYLVVNC